MPFFSNFNKLSTDQRRKRVTKNVASLVSSELNALFDKLNRNLFNNALAGIDVKWCNILKSRTSLSVNCTTNLFSSQTTIYLSKQLLSKCTRKQLIESLLYEMAYIYIWAKVSKPNASGRSLDDDEKVKSLQALLNRAMQFLNRYSGTTLSFNYSIRAHRTTQKSDEWIGIDSDVDHHQFNDSVICISDSDSDDENDVDSVRKTGCEIVTQRLRIQPIADREWTVSHSLENSFCLCCTDYNKLFADYFAATKFKLDSLKSVSMPKCPLCCEPIEPDSLNAHFDNACSVLSFRVV